MLKYCIWVVDGPFSRVFDEVALGLQGAFKSLGYEVSIVRKYDAINGYPVILGGHLIQFADDKRVPNEGVMFNLEYIGSDSKVITEEYLNLLKRFEVWDFLKVNIENLKKLGIKAKYCPIWYSSCLTVIPMEYPTIDVLFYGGINERRKKIIDQLRQLGIKVMALFNVFGQERDKYIAKSKMVLNIKYYEGNYFEAVRISYLLANQKFVVSERVKEVEEPYQKGIVFGDYEDLVEICQRYLKNNEDREYKAEEGFWNFSKYKQSDILKGLIGV